MIDQQQLTFDPPPPVCHLDREDRKLTIQKRFEKFHQLNPWIYKTLVRLARDLKKRDANRFGIKMLWEIVRWQYMLAVIEPSGGYRLNNNYTSRYARLIASQEYDLKDVFETRELKAE